MGEKGAICIIDSDEEVSEVEEISSPPKKKCTDSESSSKCEKPTARKKKTTRRGIKLIDLLSNTSELEEELSSSEIYTSKIFDYREQKKTINEYLNIIGTEEDSDSGLKVEETKERNPDSSSKKNRGSSISEAERNPSGQSPSPPPANFSYKTHSRRKGRYVSNKKTEILLSEIERNKLLYQTTRETGNDSYVDIDEDSLETDVRRIIEVKFRWQGLIIKIPMEKQQKFVTILSDLAQKCQTVVTKLLLVIQDKTIKPEDSPLSLQLSLADIIDCYIVKSSEKECDENTITLQVQANDSKKKIVISMNKLSSMSYLMEEYAKQRNISLDKLKFKFDGDKLKPTDTPTDLDMEDDNCIDVVVMN